MNVAVLYSGGKDSNYALYLASQEHSISCLITLESENPESYMFQSAGNTWVDSQADALEIPLLRQQTKGNKEEELEDLRKAITRAKEEYKIEGIVTGAIQSAYQSSRVQKICHELDLWCFNPLWQINEESFLQDLIEKEFRVMIIGVFSYPLEQKHIGQIIDRKFVEEYKELKEKYQISMIGEGGEFESFVLDSPLFKKKLVITDQEITFENNAGELKIKDMEAMIK